MIAVPVEVRGVPRAHRGRGRLYTYRMGPFELRSRVSLRGNDRVVATPFYDADGAIAGMDLHPYDGDAEAVLEVHNSGRYTLPANRVAQVVAVRDRHTLVVHAPAPEPRIVVPPARLTRHAVVRYRQRVLGGRGSLRAAEEELEGLLRDAIPATVAEAERVRPQPPAEGVWTVVVSGVRYGLFVDRAGNVLTVVRMR